MVYIKTKAIQLIHLDISNRGFMSMKAMCAITPVPHNHWILISFSCCNRFRTKGFRDDILPQHFYRNCYNISIGNGNKLLGVSQKLYREIHDRTLYFAYMLQMVLLHINKESTFTLQLSTPV